MRTLHHEGANVTAGLCRRNKKGRSREENDLSMKTKGLLSIGGDEGVRFTTDGPDGFVVVVTGSRAGSGVTVGVETIGDVKGNGGPDIFGLAAGEAPVAVLFDDHRLNDEGLEGIAEAIGTPDGNIVIGTIGMGAGCRDNNAIVIGEHALF